MASGPPTQPMSPAQSPFSQLPGLYTAKTNFQYNGPAATPASMRSVSSAAPSPYMGSLQNSPLVVPFQEKGSPVVSPVPFELPESLIASEPVLNGSTSKDSGSTRPGGGLMRKLSQTAKNSVQSTGQRLRRKASSTNQRRDQSSGPITRRRSDSKTTIAMAASATDLTGLGELVKDMAEAFSASGMYETASPTGDWYPPVSTYPEGTAPIVPEQLIQGFTLTKVTKRKRDAQKFFLNVEGSRVSWNGKLRPKYFCIDDIRSLRTGEEAFVNRQDLRCLDVDAASWLTVSYADPDRTKQTKTLNVYASNSQDLKLWIDTLDALSKHREDLMTGMTGSVEREDVIKQHWKFELARQRVESGDEAQEPGLQLASIEALCRKLHIHCPKAIIHDHFSCADVRGIGRLNYDQFKVFVRGLKERRDLLPIFDSVRAEETTGILQSQFLAFLESVQKLDISTSRAYWEGEFKRWAMNNNAQPCRVSPDTLPMAPLAMNYESFTSFMKSTACDVYFTSNRKSTFDRPLNEYFISSSHNTYLKGRQVAGESSTEAYIAALRHGCRCVEIDCWNGGDGRPIVTHGRTKTSSILFSDCIKVIDRYAFDASPYPLVLSLEVHCDAEQQGRMVAHMKDTFSNKLLLAPINSVRSRLPSPEELKHKILVKVKSSSSILEVANPLDIGIVGRQRSISSPIPRPVLPSTVIVPNIPPLPSPVSSLNERSMTTTSASSADEESDCQAIPRTTPTTPVRKAKLTNIVQPLADLGVYLQGYRYKSFETSEAQEYNHIFSLDEGRANGICSNYEENAVFEEHNRLFMSRVYPRGSRLDSSNFDPNTYWRRGVQMVALNWQTYDQYLQMNQAMFAAGSDRHGYVLKPDYMRQPRTGNGELMHRYKLPRQSVNFTVEVISAQHLPRLPDMNRGGSINPFVEVQMFTAEDRSRGNATGTGGQESSVRGGLVGIGSPYSRRTKIVTGNGYNPQFNQKFDLFVETRYPELVFVRFVVWHSPDGRYAGNKCKQLAVFTSKLSSLQQGYRHVPLYNGSGEEFIFSTLFCRINKSIPRLNPLSLQDGDERPTGQGLFRSMLGRPSSVRTKSSDRSRERPTSFEQSEA